MNNANGLSIEESERLAVLVGELGEATQAVSNVLRHGYHSSDPVDPKQDNRQDLEMELGDVYASVTMMYAAKDISETKVKKYCRNKLAKDPRHLHHQPKHISSPPAMVVVAGSRNWNNYDVFCDYLEKALKAIGVSNFVIVSGNASRGADAMAIQWAKENNIRWIPFTADWDNLGKRAGFVRNADMAEVATHLVVFWDFHSSGTKHMLDLGLNKGIPALVFKVESETTN